MSGVPGSGKSTLARKIAKEINAIVIDYDDTKTAIMSTGIEPDKAGQASYEVIKVLVRDFIAKGFNVIIDSPCLYIDLLEFGQSIAIENNTIYRYIECRVDDLEVLTKRINERTSKPSQNSLGPLEPELITHQGKPPRNRKQVFLEWAENMKRPEHYLVIDATQPKEICESTAMNYVLLPA